MRAVKKNREYVVNDGNKDFYVKQGFDIVDDDGKIVEHGKGKSVSFKEYESVKKELDELKAKRASDEDKEDEIEILRAYALEHEIDLGKASTISGIVKKIKEYVPEESGE